MPELYSNQFTDFPYEIFPIEIQILLEKAEETLNHPIQYLASSILSASSVAIGNTFNVKFKENFIVKSNLYLALVGNAGDVKTHPLNLAFEPIEKMEKEAYLNYKSLLEEYNNLSDDEKKRALKPLYKKQILKDFTPESLIKIHSINSRGIAILSDELQGWIKNFGRYNSSGEQETYLTLWSGGSISVDRKNDDPVRLDDPCVNIIGTMQTKILSDLAKDNRGNNGFIERMLFALNENPKPVLWNDFEFDKENLHYYQKLIERLYSLDFIYSKPNYVEFTKEAKNCLIDWQNTKRKKFINDDIKNGIQAKYEIYAIKFALIIQLIHWALNNKSNKKIELFSVKNALKLTDYYFKNAIKVNNKIFNRNPINELTSIQKQLYDNLDVKFNTQQALEKAKIIGITERTLYRFLKNESIFFKSKHGVYNKYT